MAAGALLFSVDASAYRMSSPYRTELSTAHIAVDGLKYVGYPQLNVEPDGLELIPEMRNHANAIAFFYDPSHPSRTHGILEQLSPSFKGVVFVDPIFFKADKTPHSDADVSRRLVAFKQAIEPYKSNIAYFAFDEPLYKRQSAYCDHALPCTNGPLHRSINDHAVPDLEKWMSQVRSTVAGPGIMWIEAGPMIQDSLDLPVNADLYGFDCYSAWNNCNGLGIKDRFSILQHKVIELNAALSGHRRLAVVREGQLVHDRKSAGRDMTAGTAASDADLVSLLKQYRSLYQNNPLVNLVGTWIWADLDPGDGHRTVRGVRGLPQARAWLESEARAISGKPQAAWQLPPVVQFHASSGARAGEHLVWTWSSTGATHCASVTEAAGFPSMPASGVVLAQELLPHSFSYTISCTGPYGTTYKTIPVTIAP